MDTSGSSRRRFLAATASVAGALGVAGCPTDGDGSDDGGGTADGATPTDGSSPTSTADDLEAVSTGEVTFEAPHGATIEATAYGDGDCGVVLVPQINRDRESWEAQGRTVARAGHLALAIDEDPDARAASVRGAIRYLWEEAGVSTVVLVGASSGGEAVVVATAETDAAVDGTMTLSAAGGADRAAELQGRTLFVVAANDDDRFVETTRALHEDAPEPTDLVEYGGSAHGQGLFDSAHGQDLRGRFEAFVTDVCGS